jgi:hypothetical protein
MAAHAQLTVFAPGPGPSPYSNEKREKYLEELKKSTTIFILQYRDYAELEQYEKVIRDAWKYTPYKIIRPEELPGYEGKTGYTFFTFGVYYTGKHNFMQHLTYSLWSPELNKKGKFKKQYFHAMLLLYPENNIRSNMYPYYDSKNKYDINQMGYLLDSVHFYNWNAALLRGYLLASNAHLQSASGMDGSRHFADGKLQALKKDTLYIPDYTRIQGRDKRGNYFMDSSLTAANLKESYPYLLKFVSTEQLSKLILDDKREIYYLSFVVDGSDKYVSAYSSRTGVLYASWHMLSWAFKDKDLARIASSIENTAEEGTGK